MSIALVSIANAITTLPHVSQLISLPKKNLLELFDLNQNKLIGIGC